jgi:mannitol 2-dehydrogenase
VLVEALRRRRAQGVPPFTVLSCDNVPGNGNVARRSVVAFARRKDPELGEWIAQHIAFPNGMVDRIAPVTSDNDRIQLAERFGIADAWPAVCEPFTQWVIEDRFPQGRPPLDHVGVQLVDDVEPYELMKLRLLNAGHQALCYFGYLAGYRFAHEVMANDLFPRLLQGYWAEEARPTLRPVPGVDLDAYCRTLIERFGNPEVRDTLARLCAETSDRIPKFLLPVVRERLAEGGAVRRSAAIVASWARYAEGLDEAGRPIDVVDPLKQTLMEAAARNRANPTAFLENRAVFGDLVDDPRFVRPYVEALASLHDHGALETLRKLATPSSV